MKGPKAPKNPVEKRPAVYVMLDDLVEGSPREGGDNTDIYYLEGRISAQITAITPTISSEIAEGVQSVSGLRKIVHSIGISLTPQDKDKKDKVATFSLCCNAQKGQQGTVFSTKVPCNGEEALIDIADYPEAEQDTILASFCTSFPEYMTAKSTICFYLNEGYEVPAAVIDAPINAKSDDYRNMIQRSLLHQGNVTRIQKAIAKAKQGKDVTIAYIGGSITQGAGAKPINTQCYAYQSYLAFRNRFAPGEGENVHFIKAGVGGTSSELGLTRYEMDVLRYGAVEPDIVIIEFAVNDEGDETKGVCYESLALMAMNGLGNPAVVLLFSVFMNDWNLQDRLARVGYHYNLPMVSVKEAVVPQFYDENPVITKRQYFHDLLHPSNSGHKVMADSLDYLWEQANIAPMEGEDIEEIKAPIIGNTYQNLKAFTRENVQNHSAVIALEAGSFVEQDKQLQCVEKDTNAFCSPEFEHNWMYDGNGDNDSFQMTIKCKDLLLIYKDSGDLSFGTIEVWLDNIMVKRVNPLDVGWNHCNALIIGMGDVVQKHHVAIKMIPEDNSKKFTILGFGYTL